MASKKKSSKSPAEKARRRRLALLFNITPEEYDAVLEYQNGVCAISGQKYGKLVIDHCHVSGKVRGLLNWRINKALEAFNDNPQWLRAAANYIENCPFTLTLGEDVYGVVGSISKKAKNRRYGPDGRKIPKPRMSLTTK